MNVQDLLVFGAVMLILGVPFWLIWFLISGNNLGDDKANDWKR